LKNNKNIEDLLKDKLNQEFEYYDSDIDELSDILDEYNDEPKRKKGIFFIILAGLILFVSALGAIFSSSSIQKESKNNKTIIENTNFSENEDNQTFSNEISKPNTQAKSIHNNNEYTFEEQNNTNSKEQVNTDKTSSNNLFQSENNNAVKTQNVHINNTETKNIVSSNKLKENETFEHINSTATENNHSSTSINSNKTENQTQTTSETIVTSTSSVNSKANTLNTIDPEDKKLLNNSISVEEEKLSKENIEEIKSTNDTLKENKLLIDSLQENSEIVSNIQDKKDLGIIISLKAGPSFLLRQFKSENSKRNSEESNIIAWNASLEFTKTFKNNIILGTGLNVINYGENINYKPINYIKKDTSYQFEEHTFGLYSISKMNGILNVDTTKIKIMDTILIVNESELQDKTVTLENGKTNFTYIEIPLQVGYNFFKANKINLSAMTGVSIGFLVDSKGYYLNNENTLSEAASAKIIYNYLLSLDFKYNIYNNLSINLSPHFKQNLNNLSIQKEVNRKYSSFGINAGISVEF